LGHQSITDILPVVFRTIEWAIAPVALVALFIYGFFCIPRVANEPLPKDSAVYGRWAGLLIFVIFLLIRKHRINGFSFVIPSYEFDFLKTLCGVAAGFVFSLIVDCLRRFRVLGVLTMLFVSAASIGLYAYVLVESFRVPLLFISIGLAFGTLLHRVFFPPRKVFD
jgi:hypothetical protein